MCLTIPVSTCPPGAVYLPYRFHLSASLASFAHLPSFAWTHVSACLASFTSMTSLACMPVAFTGTAPGGVTCLLSSTGLPAYLCDWPCLASPASLALHADHLPDGLRLRLDTPSCLPAYMAPLAYMSACHRLPTCLAPSPPRLKLCLYLPGLPCLLSPGLDFFPSPDYMLTLAACLHTSETSIACPVNLPGHFTWRRKYLFVCISDCISGIFVKLHTPQISSHVLRKV